MNRTLGIKIVGNGTGPTVSRGKRDRVRWTATGGAVTICFRDQRSPFDSYEFHVDVGQPTDSGPVRENADLGEYEYDVFAGDINCGEADPTSALDPKIFVDP